MNFPQLSLANPELRRLARSNFSLNRALLASVLTILGLVFFTFVAWAEAYDSYAQRVNVANFGRNVNYFAQVGMFAALFVLAPALTALSFIQEKLRGTAIFQQMSLLSPSKVLIGKFLGHGLLSYLIALLILPVYLASAPLHSDTAKYASQILCAIIVGGLSWQAVALYLSAVTAGTNDKPMRGGLLLSPLLGGAGAIAAMFLVSTARTDSVSYFYGVPVPFFFIPMSVLAFGGAWALIGALRHIKASQLIPLSPVTTWLFFLTGEALLCGFLWGRADFDTALYYNGGTAPRALLMWYVFCNFAALLGLASSTVLNRTQLREWQSVLRDPHYLLRRTELLNTAKTFVIALGLAEAGLVALWFSYHAGLSDFPANLELFTQLLPLVLCLALSVIGAGALVQFSALCRFRWQGGAGVAFVAALFVATLIGASIVDKGNNVLALANPILYVAAVGEHDRTLEMTAEVRSGSYLQRPWCPENMGSFFVETEPRCINKYQKESFDKAAIALDRNTLTARAWGGVIIQMLWAILAFGLACYKWRNLRAAAGA